MDLIESPGSPETKCVTKHGPFSRQFWSAGEGDFANFSMPVQGGMDHVRVHPKFLHSNATSHKWALGAVAELLDNAVDESQNGATYVKVDKDINPRDQSPALDFIDNGGGMTPDKLRMCMSFGYSQKSANSIGQYGNGFKTSTMRLGADVVVFTRSVNENGVATQSIGMLSYTYLCKTGLGDTIVPMIDYQGHGRKKRLVRTDFRDWDNNLKAILEWSPYETESELLQQCEKLGTHGTKVLVYNLWLNDDGLLELDFDSNSKDIKLRGDATNEKNPLNANHISHRLRYSLRAYASILYLKLPPKFQIILRGQPVQHYVIAKDLKYPEHVQYKPQVGGVSTKEVSAITTIGFTQEAPLVSIHGFNVYHKNRLIMPFWKVLTDNSSRGRGVVGVLEANFIEPAHDKQDFEKTALLIRLETRLKQMTIEYWNLHCDKVGYQTPGMKAMNKKNKLPSCSPASSPVKIPGKLPFTPPPQSGVAQVSETTQENEDEPVVLENHRSTKKRRLESLDDSEDCTPTVHQASDFSGFKLVVEENTRLHLRCAELEMKQTEFQKRCSELEMKQSESQRFSELEAEAGKKAKFAEYEQRCNELQSKVSRYERDLKKLELQKTEYQVKLDVAETELLEVKNKYIKLLMTVNMQQAKREVDS